MILVIFVLNCLTRIIFFLNRYILPASKNLGKAFLLIHLMDVFPHSVNLENGAGFTK